MNKQSLSEQLQQIVLTGPQQRQFYDMIRSILQNAIDARSPKKRPPGKAGLRAEKGYYRLLYLENDLLQYVNTLSYEDSNSLGNDWDHLLEMLRQLNDIPELQKEVEVAVQTTLTGIDY